jgi:phosphomannomutase
MDFCEDNEVYFVTGSDRKKTIEQLGEEIYNRAVRVYNCSGNSVWEKDELVHAKHWEAPSKLIDFLIKRMRMTFFDPKDWAGNHIEHRPGCLNFSVVGRNADWFHRQKYIAYDEMYHERTNIANDINFMFTDLHASIGGETGIDIYPKGWDKSQVLKMHFEDCSDVCFFGDKIEECGNDYTIAEGVIERGGQVFAVTDFYDTWETLLTLKTPV